MMTLQQLPKTLEQEIADALFEATHMHVGESDERIILTAMRLSGAPYPFIQAALEAQREKAKQ